MPSASRSALPGSADASSSAGAPRAVENPDTASYPSGGGSHYARDFVASYLLEPVKVAPRSWTPGFTLRRIDLILIILVTLAGLGLRISRYGQSLFADEISTLWIVRNNDLSGVISTVKTDAEISPPLYFVLAWFSTKLGSAPELVRLPSLIAGVLSIPLVYVLALTLANRRAAMVAATVMALSPFMIYYSGEGRNYAVMVFLVVISTLSMVIAARGGWRWLWAVYALSSCLALYSHYTAVFVLFGQFLWLVWAHPRARRPALLANVAVLIGFLPWLPGFRADGDSPTTALANQLLPFNFSTAVDSVLFWSVGAANNFVLKLDDMPGPLALALIAAALIVALAGIVIRAVSEPGFRAKLVSPPAGIVLIVVLTLATPVGETLYSLVETGILGSRNLNASWPGLAMLLGLLVTSAGATTGLVATVLLVAGYGTAAVKSVSTGTATPNYRAAAEFIEENAEPGDVVVDIFTAYSTPVSLTPLDVYLPQTRPEFRPGLPEGPPPYLTGVPPEVPEAQWRDALKQAGDRQIFFVQPDYDSRLAPIEDVDPIPGVWDDKRFTERVLNRLPKGFRIVDREEFPGLYPVKVTVVAGPEAP